MRNIHSDKSQNENSGYIKIEKTPESVDLAYIYKIIKNWLDSCLLYYNKIKR